MMKFICLIGSLLVLQVAFCQDASAESNPPAAPPSISGDRPLIENPPNAANPQDPAANPPDASGKKPAAWHHLSRSANPAAPRAAASPRAAAIPKANQSSQSPILDPIPAGHIADPPVGPLGPLGPLAAKGITWNDVVVAKPNPISVHIQRPGQVIQLLVPVTIFVSDKWVPLPAKPKNTARRTVGRATRRPAQSQRRRRVVRAVTVPQNIDPSPSSVW